MALKFLRSAEVDKRRGRSKSQRHVDINDGVFVPPVRVCAKLSVYPEHEVDAIIAAELRGAAKSDLRELVSRLVAARRTTGLNAQDDLAAGSSHPDAARPVGVA